MMLRKLLVVVSIFIVLLSVTWLSMRRADIPYNTLEGFYASETSQFLTLADGLNVHYRDEGKRDGHPVVLVHGFSASLHTWEPWVEALSDEYRVISLDLPGHGLTRSPPPEKMNVPYFAEVVGEVAHRLGATDYTLVGNSMGGATAWQFALSRQDQLDGLVLVAASGWQEQQITGDRPAIFSLLANKFARNLIKDFDLKALIRSGLKDSFYDPDFVTDDMVSRYSYLSRAPGHREGILALMSGEERMPARAETLQKIKIPTLILQGTHDNLVNPAGAPKFQDAIPGAELIVYENIGHLPQEETPATSAEDLKRFLTTRVWPEPIDVLASGEEAFAND